MHPKLIVIAMSVVAIAKAAPIAWRELQAERTTAAQRRAGLAARADQQNAWTTAGDPWGTSFGSHPPAC